MFVAVTSSTTFVSSQNYSLVIGVDGMGSYGLEAAVAPNMQAIKSGSWAAGYQGAYTLSAFAGGMIGAPTQQPTLSGPGWSSLLTGTWADRHGVVDNGFAGRQYQTYPAYLKLLEAGLPTVRTSGVVSWTPIDTFVFAPAAGTSNIDTHVETADNDVTTTSTAVAQLGTFASNTNAALFVHFDDVDHAGHSSGAYSTSYLTNLNDVDSQIGQLLSAIRDRPTFAGENWQVLVVADHGHLGGGGHGGQTSMERTLPILLSGKNVTAGAIGSAGQAPAQIDVATTVLDHFGVAKPAYMAGQALTHAATPLNGATLLNGLVGHLDFNGDAAGTLAGNGGTVTGTIQYVTGRFGQAGLVGTYGSGSVLLNDDLGATFGTSTDFAVSLWMKYDAATGDPAFFGNKNWQNGTNTGLNLSYRPATTGIDVNTKAATGVRTDIRPQAGFESGAWHHVLLNVDRDGETLLYVDGALYGEATASSLGSFDGAFNFRLFNDGTGTYSSGTFSNLMLDEFSAWNRLLNDDEIAFLSTSALTATAVPEPGVWGLAAFLVPFAAAVRRRRRSKGWFNHVRVRSVRSR